MQGSIFIYRVLGVCASLVIAVSCRGLQTQTSPPIPSQLSAATSSPGLLSGKAAWMTSDAQTRDLLYVSHRDGRVYAYAFSAGNLQGRLTDVQAGGLCSDRNGDVFIPERNQIREYAHGGTRPIAVFRNTFGTVFHFCAVDPASGDLAVSGSADPKFGVVI